MTTGVLDRANTTYSIPLKFNFDFSEEQFFEFCQLNNELRIEKDKNGTIHIMTPTGFILVHG